jgi:hypothetical protein
MRAFSLCLLLAVAPDHAATDSPLSSAEILARAKIAQGGEAWDGVRTLRLTGTISSGGLSGTSTTVSDVRTGRFHDARELGPLKGSNGFDGREAWSQDSSGQSRADGADTPFRTAITESYRRAQAWWYPARHPAEVRALGERREGERRFYALSISPADGRRFELWVDASTWLFDRSVEQIDTDTFITYLSDWRDVGGVKIPHSARTVRVGDEGKHDTAVVVTRAERDVPIEDVLFARPGPPPRDFGLAAGQTSATVPFLIINGHIYVDVKLNGRGPYRLLLDSGGENIVTPALARELGLKSSGEFPVSGGGEGVEDIGATEVDRLEIGDAYLTQQTFYVYPIDRANHVEGMPQQGLVGYAVFRRFVTRIDYEHRQLTLFDPASFTYTGSGAVVPFVFYEHIPQVKGTIDGLPGTFDIDTGARSSLTLMSPFVTRHRLIEKMQAGPERIVGWGIGGPSRGRVARAHLLELGPVKISAPVTGLSTSKRGFANPDIAGNVGFGVLSRFTVIFDYGRQHLILEKNGLYGRPDNYDKSGLWLHAAQGGWDVMEVVPDTPAAQAGLAVGDRILAVDGDTPAALSLPDLRLKLRNLPAGTSLGLRVRRGEAERDVKLVLRELL